jgi:acetyl esterase/lipase
MENVDAYRDLQYGSGSNRRQMLDLYVPKDARAPLPVIAWIHGGAWMQGDKSNCPALPFAAKGFAVASIGYRLSREAKFPAQINDCKAAIRYLRANAARYNIDPDRIGVWGSSAGGHLVALLGTSGDVKELQGDGPNGGVSSSVQAVADWFGPTDFLQMSKFPSNIRHDEAGSPESQLVGGPIQQNADKVAAANPISYVKKGGKYPPFLIMHGDKDPLVPLNQSELLRDALKGVEADVTFIPVKGGGHGGWPASQNDIVLEFFTKVLVSRPASSQPATATAPVK